MAVWPGLHHQGLHQSRVFVDSVAAPLPIEYKPRRFQSSAKVAESGIFWVIAYDRQAVRLPHDIIMIASVIAFVKTSGLEPAVRPIGEGEPLPGGGIDR